MQNLKNGDEEIIFKELADRLLRTNNWQMVNKCSNNILFKEVSTNRTYQLLESSRFQKIQLIDEQQTIDVVDDMLASSYKQTSPIFLNIVRISDQYYLYEKSVMSLQLKIKHNKNSREKTRFEEDQILNTFVPILQSITRNQIPPFYQIQDQNILIDSQQNIRLENPLFKKSIIPQKEHNKPKKLCQNLSIIILQCILSTSEEVILSLINNQRNILNLLIQRSYSYKLIAIILVLLNEQSNSLSINLKALIKSNFMGPWIQDLKLQIQKTKKINSRNLNQYIEMSKTKKKVARRRNEQREDSETQDSQNMIVTKYRSGKRIFLSKKINQIQQVSNDDMNQYQNIKQKQDHQQQTQNMKKQ